jgi:hypothetical protein
MAFSDEVAPVYAPRRPRMLWKCKSGRRTRFRFMWRFSGRNLLKCVHLLGCAEDETCQAKRTRRVCRCDEWIAFGHASRQLAAEVCRHCRAPRRPLGDDQTSQLRQHAIGRVTFSSDISEDRAACFSPFYADVIGRVTHFLSTFISSVRLLENSEESVRSARDLAGRQGISEIRFRLFADSCRLQPTLSDCGS